MMSLQAVEADRAACTSMHRNAAHGASDPPAPRSRYRHAPVPRSRADRNQPGAVVARRQTPRLLARGITWIMREPGHRSAFQLDDDRGFDKQRIEAVR